MSKTYVDCRALAESVLDEERYIDPDVAIDWASEILSARGYDHRDPDNPDSDEAWFNLVRDLAREICLAADRNGRPPKWHAEMRDA